MRSVPGLTARSNPRLSLPFQSSNREKKKKKKIGKRKGIICQLRGVRQRHANNKRLFDHKYQNFEGTLPAAWGLISLISILKILSKIYQNSRI